MGDCGCSATRIGRLTPWRVSMAPVSLTWSPDMPGRCAWKAAAKDKPACSRPNRRLRSPGNCSPGTGVTCSPPKPAGGTARVLLPFRFKPHSLRRGSDLPSSPPALLRLFNVAPQSFAFCENQPDYDQGSENLTGLPARRASTAIGDQESRHCRQRDPRSKCRLPQTNSRQETAPLHTAAIGTFCGGRDVTLFRVVCLCCLFSESN